MSPVRGEEDLGDERLAGGPGRDREISLGTSTILGIFFALALVCSVFFGFGYSVGRKSVQTAGAPVVAATDPVANDSFKTFKPAPGSPANGTVVANGGANNAVAANNAAGFTTSYPPPGARVVVQQPGGAGAAATGSAAASIPKRPAFDPDAEIVTAPTAPAAARPNAVRPGVVASSAGAAVGTGSIVQVSAHTRQEDAETVASALRRKGYSVFIRREPQDAFLHVQLGPYATKKEAEAMRDRLSSDGFNAIVK